MLSIFFLPPRILPHTFLIGANIFSSSAHSSSHLPYWRKYSSILHQFLLIPSLLAPIFFHTPPIPLSIFLIGPNIPPSSAHSSSLIPYWRQYSSFLRPFISVTSLLVPIFLLPPFIPLRILLICTKFFHHPSILPRILRTDTIFYPPIPSNIFIYYINIPPSSSHSFLHLPYWRPFSSFLSQFLSVTSI